MWFQTSWAEDLEPLKSRYSRLAAKWAEVGLAQPLHDPWREIRKMGRTLEIEERMKEWCGEFMKQTMLLQEVNVSAMLPETEYTLTWS